jgi:uncharacterized protein YuzE
MQITYSVKTDVLYMRLDERKQPVVNRRVTDDIVLDIGEGDKIIGIEIVGASTHLNLQNILPVEIKLAAGASA